MRGLNFFFVSILFFIFISSGGVNAKGMPPDSLLQQAISMVDPDTMESYVQDLQDMGTRFMIAPNRREVATWIMEKFLSFGIEEVRLDSFQCYTHINMPPLVYDTTTWQYNVEARIEGTVYPDEEVVIIGHYDCVSQDNDPVAFSPGADDNGSGTAAIFECARIIMALGYQPERTLVFLPTAAEELMYFGDSGSEHYAEEALAAGRDIYMVINNDMISWNDGTWTIDLFNHTFSPHITAMAIDIIQNYTTLNYESWNPVMQIGGDIQPFLDAGYCGIYFMEHYFNPNYHTDLDLVENCDMAYLAEVTKISLGLLLYSDMTVGLENSSLEPKQIAIYPNPATDRIFFTMPASMKEGSYRIMDISGKTIQAGICNSGHNRVMLPDLKDGMYILILTNNKEIYRQRLMIVN
jgi:leucyl aminopeptidase